MSVIVRDTLFVIVTDSCLSKCNVYRHLFVCNCYRLLVVIGTDSCLSVTVTDSL